MSIAVSTSLISWEIEVIYCRYGLQRFMLICSPSLLAVCVCVTVQNYACKLTYACTRLRVCTNYAHKLATHVYACARKCTLCTCVPLSSVWGR